MGGQQFFTSVLTLAVWLDSALSNPGRPTLQLYLPQETFIIQDMRFLSPGPPIIPVDVPLIVPQRSFLPSNIPRQQAVLPQTSFQTSRASQTSFVPVEVPQQQMNFFPQNVFVPTDTRQQPTDYVLQNPSQQQSHNSPENPFNSVSPSQQHSDFAPLRPNLPSVDTNFPRPTTTTRQPPRASPSAGTFQQAKPSLQTDHRFSSTVRPSESKRPSTDQHFIPQRHQQPVDNGYRQTPRPQENTIRRPSNRHHLCGELPPSGDCRAAFPRYYYNNETDQCDCFLYGGCGPEGVKYSYQTLEECQSTCSPSVLTEGPTCKEIFHVDEVFHDTPTHNTPRPLQTPSQSLPRPHPKPDEGYSHIDTSHIADESFLILLLNSAKGNRDAYNTDFESNERRYK